MQIKPSEGCQLEACLLLSMMVCMYMNYVKNSFDLCTKKFMLFCVVDKKGGELMWLWLLLSWKHTVSSLQVGL